MGNKKFGGMMMPLQVAVVGCCLVGLFLVRWASSRVVLGVRTHVGLLLRENEDPDGTTKASIFGDFEVPGIITFVIICSGGLFMSLCFFVTLVRSIGIRKVKALLRVIIWNKSLRRRTAAILAAISTVLLLLAPFLWFLLAKPYDKDYSLSFSFYTVIFGAVLSGIIASVLAIKPPG